MQRTTGRLVEQPSEMKIASSKPILSSAKLPALLLRRHCLAARHFCGDGGVVGPLVDYASTWEKEGNLVSNVV